MSEGGGGGGGDCCGVLPAAFHLLPFPNTFILRSVTQAKTFWILVVPPSVATRQTVTFSLDSSAALPSKDVFCLQADIHLEILHNNANGCNVTLVLLVRSSECSGSVTSVVRASACASLTNREAGSKTQTMPSPHITQSLAFPFAAKTPSAVFFLAGSNATVAGTIFVLSLTRLKEAATVFCIIQHCNCKHYAKLDRIQVPTQKV